MGKLWCDLPTFRARTGVTAATPDGALLASLAGVQASVVSYLNFDPTPGTATEFYDGHNGPYVTLSRKYVYAVSEVRLDAGGQYGQGSPSAPPFGDATILPAGGYFLQLRGSDRTGLLVRAGGAVWPGTWSRVPGRLSPTPTPLPGCLKVTYSYGLSGDPEDSAVPADIAEAVYLEAAARTSAWATGMGTETSSSQDGHAKSITVVAGGGQAGGGSPRSPFLSGAAEMILHRYRRVAIY